MIWNLSLNEEVDLLRETVRTFAEKELAPIADPVSYTHLTLPTIVSV